jgi:hypothetical protein
MAARFDHARPELLPPKGQRPADRGDAVDPAVDRRA